MAAPRFHMAEQAWHPRCRTHPDPCTHSTWNPPTHGEALPGRHPGMHSSPEQRPSHPGRQVPRTPTHPGTHPGLQRMQEDSQTPEKPGRTAGRQYL